MKFIFQGLLKYKLNWVIALIGIGAASMTNLILPRLLSNIINIGVGNRDSGYITRVGAVMMLVAFGGMTINIIAEYNSSRMATGFARDMRSRVFHKVEEFSLAEFDKVGASSLITRTINDVIQMQTYAVFFSRVMMRAPIMSLGSIIMAWTASPALSVPLIVSIPLIVLLIAFISRYIMPLSELLQKKIDRLNLVFREKLSGIRVIRAFGTEDYEEERFEEVNGDLMSTNLKMNRTSALMMPVLTVLMNMVTVSITWFGAVQIDLGNGLQVGSVIAVAQYVMQMMFSLVMMSMAFIQYPRAMVSAGRVKEILDMPLTIRDAVVAPVETGLKATVEFRDVTFTFPGAERPALLRISFVSGPGETTAIVGSTGSGKSSLLNLIPRFYDVDEGQILINGVDVRDYNQHELRVKMGYVPQKATLFSGTVAGNIRAGNSAADDRAVREAAEIAQALDFVEEREGGFNSRVAQAGTNLSGGQKQRLSIARAIAREPEIYLFDDSFSALDYKTDSKLRAALRKKIQGESATVLLVAQRVSTVLYADRILVLDNGEMAGVGTHDELMKSCAVYREIVSSQFSDEEVAG